MWFSEPHPFPERGSPTRLSTSGQQSYKGWSCRTVFTQTTATMQVQYKQPASLHYKKKKLKIYCSQNMLF